jgi:hypothetical protein
MRHNRLPSVTFAIAVSLFVASAHASPLGRLHHLHSAAASAKESRISFTLYNRSEMTQDFDIAGQKYTLKPNSELTITAPAGAQVIAETENASHKKGDVLFTVQTTLRNQTVTVR